MFKYILGLFLFCSTSVFAASQGFQWDYGSVTGVTGFKLYCGDSAGNNGSTPVATVNATVKTATVTVPPASTKYCVVTAYNATKESGKSNEVVVDTAPDAPTNLRLTMEITFDNNGHITGWKVAKIN